MGNNQVRPVRRFDVLRPLLEDGQWPNVTSALRQTYRAFAFYRRGRILGCVLLTAEQTNLPSLRLTTLFVEESSRNQGIGTALMKRVIAKYASSFDLYLIVDATSSRKDDLFRFYKRFGFHLVPEVSDYGNHILYQQRKNHDDYKLVALYPNSYSALFALGKADLLADRSAEVFRVSAPMFPIVILDSLNDRFCGVMIQTDDDAFGIWAYPYVDRAAVAKALLGHKNPRFLEGTPGVTPAEIPPRIYDKIINFCDSEQWTPDSEDVVFSFY